MRRFFLSAVLVGIGLVAMDAQSVLRLRVAPTVIDPIPPPPPTGTFDASEYRTTTYGAPDRYCDATRSLSNNGAGTLADPWNYTQCQANPVAGEVIGHLPVGAGTPVDLPVTGDEAMPAFQPANSGTLANPIVHVAKFAAIALPRLNLGTNQNRTEMRTNAVAPTIVGGAGQGNGTSTYGANGRNYVWFDGFYTDMIHAYMAEDSGMLTCRAATSIKFLNFVIKGATLTIASNPVIYRPDNCTGGTLSNFWVFDFNNDSTGSATPQEGLFSDQYGDQNYLIEYGDIDNVERGPFPKGTAVSATVFNYGTMRYNIIHDLDSCFRFNDFDANDLTEIHHNLCYNYGNAYGAALSSETSDPRYVFIHHNTFANSPCNDINCSGPFYIKDAASMNNVSVRDNIFDWLNGGFGHGVDAGELPCCFPTFNYNGYYKAGAAITWAYNGVESSSLAAWRTATGQEANSLVLATSPFTNRAANDYTIAGGHAALTASSTGGELGAYEGTNIIGPFGSY